MLDVTNHRLLVHGHAVAVRCAVPQVSARILHELGSMMTTAWPRGANPICGYIGHYDGAEVRHRLAAEATLIDRSGDGVELYECDHRYWRIDDRRGVVEMCPQRNVWRSWVLADGAADSAGVMESSLLWPAAQLLRQRDLFLVPAIAVARDGWGLLILCPYPLERELRTLTDAGFDLVGQSWVGLREAGGRLSILSIRARTRRSAMAGASGFRSNGVNAGQIPCDCDAVLIVEPSRRPVPRLRAVDPEQAASALRRAWPMVELHPHRRTARLPALLARHCGVYQGQLTPDARHLLRFANAIRFGLTDGLAVSAVSTPSATGIWRPTARPVVTIGTSVRARVSGSPPARQQRHGLMGRLRQATAKTPAIPSVTTGAQSDAVPAEPLPGETPWLIAG